RPVIEIDSLSTHSSAKTPRRCNARHRVTTHSTAMRYASANLCSPGLAHRWLVPLKDVTGDCNPPRSPSVCVCLGDLTLKVEALSARWPGPVYVQGTGRASVQILLVSVWIYERWDARRRSFCFQASLPSGAAPRVPRKQALGYSGLGRRGETRRARRHFLFISKFVPISPAHFQPSSPT
ncbi:hypothetical protein CORC01_11280, partial [Colletotrichum orchidophilum]